MEQQFASNRPYQQGKYVLFLEERGVVETERGEMDSNNKRKKRADGPWPETAGAHLHPPLTSSRLNKREQKREGCRERKGEEFGVGGTKKRENTQISPPSLEPVSFVDVPI